MSSVNLNVNPMNCLLEKQWDLSLNLPQPPANMEISEIMHQIQQIDDGLLTAPVPDGLRRYRRFLIEEMIERWVNSHESDQELQQAIKCLLKKIKKSA